jgi:hypothetical protein
MSAFIEQKVKLRAVRNIEPGQEILLSYINHLQTRDKRARPVTIRLQMSCLYLSRIQAKCSPADSVSGSQNTVNFTKI